MKIVEKRAFMVLFVAIILSSFASAEMLIGQTKTRYNIGDDFTIQITLSASKFTSDFFVATLVCQQGDNLELFRSPYTVKEGESKEVTISTNLGNFLVGERKGTCYLKTTFDGEESESQNFEVLNTIDVTLNIDGTSFDPGTNVKIYGRAVKQNDVPLDGFVEIELPALDFKISTPVANGDFRINLTIPDNAPSGEYQINAKAYEKDESGSLMNQGAGTNKIRIKQSMKELVIAFEKQTVSPGSELLYTIMAYDQAGETIDADASVIIFNPGATITKKAIVKTGKSNVFKTEAASTPGYWTIQTKSGDLADSKTFLVEEKPMISFSLEGQALTVTNIGNVPYTKPFEVLIGGVNEVKELGELAVGSSRKFKLAAPEGSYEIEINDGTNHKVLGSTFLTGRAVSVEDFSNSSNQNFILLIILIGILIIAILTAFIYRRISKNRIKGGKISSMSSSAKIPLSKATTPIQKSGANVIDKGEMRDSEIIAFHIKNSETLTPESPAFKALDSALWKGTEAGAKVYADGEYKIMVFNELLTKQKDNILSAISTAQSIERSLKEYNRRSAQKINFGIGINSGRLIVEKKEGKFKFISSDNSIIGAKKMAREAESQIFVSEAIHRKTIGKVKVEKLKDKPYWTLDRVIDRSAHNDFIKGFVSRQKFEQRKY